jgi:sterol desaturase/sphingolipid hydroxylase (fatty acid hydroxylase superfamily)
MSLILEAVAFALFGGLSLLFHDRKGQPLIRRDFADDALYFIVAVLITGRAAAWLYAMVSPPALVRTVAAWPLWLQALVIVIAFDFMQYGLHRWFHGNALWRFHAVHHSAEEIDVLTSFRIHPVNFAVYSVLPTALLLFLGFSPAAFAVLAPFNFLMSCLTHANLSWSFGPFRYVLSSPMFHRWHHAVIEGGAPRNLSPNFPVWDLLFGTYYMPKGERPVAYGAPGVPASFTGQMAFPFSRRDLASGASR